MKHTVSEQGLALVEKKLSEFKGRLSPEDAASATGLIISEAQDALMRLMELYVTRISYDENGRIIFDFDMPLRERGTKTLAEKWASVRERFWKAFKVFYKIWIAVVMIGYFAVMAVLLILLMFASSQGDDDDSGIGGNAIGGLFHVLAEGLRFVFWTNAFSGGYGRDVHGYRYRKAKVPEGMRKKKDKKSFMIAVYDFALGPERVQVDPLENEKEAAAFLREERGVITSAEVLALSGDDFVKAEERMADYLARFGGEARITDEGVVVGEFEDLITRSTDVQSKGEIVPFWDEYEAPYEVTGNSTGRNILISCMALFTLLVGLVMGPAEGLTDLGNSVHPFFGTGFSYFLLGYMPVFFALSYLLLPILRAPLTKRKERQRVERNRKKQIMRSIFTHQLWRTTLDEIYQSLPERTRKELNKGSVESIVEELLIDLQGEREFVPNEPPVYVFGRLQREYEAANGARKLLKY